MTDARDVRRDCRTGALQAPTAGKAMGYAQANLVALQAEHAHHFRAYAARNRKPCPILEELPPGAYKPDHLAPDADVRTDLPKYNVWRHGALSDQVSDVSHLYTDDMCTFLIGCSFSFEEALQREGIPIRHIQEERNVPMYITSWPTVPAGPFGGPLVVSMRPLTPEDARRAAQITARFPRVHGAPVHIGDPSVLGIASLDQPDFGDAVTVYEGEVPVFWACGVTPQLALQRAKLPLVITHAPGYMFVSDLLNDSLASAPAAAAAADDAPSALRCVLRSGASLDAIGVGTSSANAGTVVAEALRLGYRHIDCAAIYNNEHEVGAAICASQVPRSSLFVVSKLWNDRRRREDVRDAVFQTLRDLGLKYLDLYLVHWPVVWARGTLMKPDATASLREAWAALEELVDEGLLRHIGVSNFDEEQLATLMSYARVLPAANQIELHPRLPQRKLVAFCKSHGILPIAYSPLGRGTRGGLVSSSAVASIAAEHGVTTGSVILRWMINQGVAGIPLSSNPTRLRSNLLEPQRLTLAPNETRALDALDDATRIVRPPWHTFPDATPWERFVRLVGQSFACVVFSVVTVDLTKMWQWRAWWTTPYRVAAGGDL